MNVEFVSQASVDGSVRVGLRTPRDAVVEAVYLPNPSGYGLCVSTQAGCDMGCGFCATSRIRPSANLTADEIVEQVETVQQALGLLTGPDHLTTSGMGEPLANFDATVESCARLARAHPAASISVSTVGLVRRMRQLADSDFAHRLYLSLHAGSDATRRRLIRVSRGATIATLVDALEQFAHRRPLGDAQVSYLLLAGVNDDDAELRGLIAVLRHRAIGVQLLMLNAVPGLPYRRVAEEVAERWRVALIAAGIIAYVRPSQGGDVGGGCGQLTGSLRRE